MSTYRTNNKAVPVNATPLFASCWLALFNELRENFYTNPEIADFGENLTLLNEEPAEPGNQSAMRP